MQRIWPFVLAGVAVVGAVVTFISVSAATAPARTISARDWQLIAKDPEAHDGERTVLSGEITQFDTALGPDRFRASVDAVQHATDELPGYNTTAVLSGSRSDLAGVVEGDVFRAEVAVEGTWDYRMLLDGDITVPALTVTEIQVIGSPRVVPRSIVTHGPRLSGSSATPRRPSHSNGRLAMAVRSRRPVRVPAGEAEQTIEHRRLLGDRHRAAGDTHLPAASGRSG
jgi:hypothetical protein